MALNMGATSKLAVVAVVAMLLVVSIGNVRVEAQEQESPAPGPVPGPPESASPGSLLSSLIYTALVAVVSFVATKAF